MARTGRGRIRLLGALVAAGMVAAACGQNVTLLRPYLVPTQKSVGHVREVDGAALAGLDRRLGVVGDLARAGEPHVAAVAHAREELAEHLGPRRAAGEERVHRDHEQAAQVEGSNE